MLLTSPSLAARLPQPLCREVCAHRTCRTPTHGLCVHGRSSLITAARVTTRGRLGRHLIYCLYTARSSLLCPCWAGHLRPAGQGCGWPCPCRPAYRAVQHRGDEVVADPFHLVGRLLRLVQLLGLCQDGALGVHANDLWGGRPQGSSLTGPAGTAVQPRSQASRLKTQKPRPRC